MPDEKRKFLQTCFAGYGEDQVSARCNYNHIEIYEERAIVTSLETIINENEIS